MQSERDLASFFRQLELVAYFLRSYIFVQTIWVQISQQGMEKLSTAVLLKQKPLALVLRATLYLVANAFKTLMK